MNAWAVWALVGFAAVGAARTAAAAPVDTIAIDGPIGPATAGYVSRAIEVSEADGATCLIVQLDTPGGLLDSMNAIVQAFYRSKVPIVVYVSPPGAGATSAGCFITLAADVAAMAPNTTIGAAHPVEMGGFGAEGADPVMTKKLENYGASVIEAIAERRHRNAAWAETAVRESASITAEKALQLRVIDLIAPDVPALLRELDGRTFGGRTLHTAQAEVNPIPMISRERLFQALWRPEVIFALMLIAIFGIIGELSNPGAILPGVAGGIALILSLYLGAALPISAAGVALIALALVLFILDVHAPTHGVLTVGGVVAFFLGSLLLFEPAGPGFRLSPALAGPAAIVMALFFLFVVGAGLRAQRLPRRVGPEAMVGQVGKAQTPIDRDGGTLSLAGETWNARSDVPIGVGQPAVIEAVHGLTLTVRPSASAEAAPAKAAPEIPR